MRVETILNAIQKFKCFVYEKAKLVRQGKTLSIEIHVKPRRNSHAICSGCCKPRPCYDRLKERRFEFVPLWGIAVFLCYRMRRVSCDDCGIKVEQVPWC